MVRSKPKPITPSALRHPRYETRADPRHVRALGKKKFSLVVPRWIRKLPARVADLAIRAIGDRHHAITDGYDRCARCLTRVARADALLLRVGKTSSLSEEAVKKAIKRAAKLYCDAAFECEANEHMVARYERNQFLRWASLHKAEEVLVKLAGQSPRGRPRSVHALAPTEFDAEQLAEARWRRKYGASRESAPHTRFVHVGKIASPCPMRIQQSARGRAR